MNAKPLILEKITSGVLPVILTILWLDTFKSPVELFINEFFKCDENEDDPNELEDSEDDTWCVGGVIETTQSTFIVHCSVHVQYNQKITL